MFDGEGVAARASFFLKSLSKNEENLVLSESKKSLNLPKASPKKSLILSLKGLSGAGVGVAAGVVAGVEGVARGAAMTSARLAPEASTALAFASACSWAARAISIFCWASRLRRACSSGES